MGSNLSRIEKTRIPYFSCWRQLLQKIAHCDGDFLHVGFERKVSSITGTGQSHSVSGAMNSVASARRGIKSDNRMRLSILDTGHFALETHVEEIAIAMRDFLQKLPPNEK